MTEDYWQGENENPYDKSTVNNDWEDYEKPTHRATKTGVLSSYKKQINLTANDYIMKDFYDNMRDMKMGVAQ